MSQAAGSDKGARGGQKVDWSKLPEDVFKLMEDRTAQNSAEYLLPTLEEIQRRNPQMTLLDVGAGSAAIAASFAKMICPGGGHVTAVDVNPVGLERAKSILTDKYGLPAGAGAGEDWISFRACDAQELPFADDSFDVVHCHQVLAHNKDQVDMLREMLRVAKPGGVVAAREGDMETESFWPPLPGLLKFNDQIECGSARRRGASTQAGRELLSWALKANGWDRSKITTSFSTWNFSELERRRFWSTGMINVAIGNPLVREMNIKAGITEADMDEMRDAWMEWRDRDDATLSMMHGEIIMRK